MKTAGIVHLPSFGIVLTIFTGLQKEFGELVSRPRKKLHPHSVVAPRYNRLRRNTQDAEEIVNSVIDPVARSRWGFTAPAISQLHKNCNKTHTPKLY
jgi:hypothetical protein